MVSSTRIATTAELNISRGTVYRSVMPFAFTSIANVPLVPLEPVCFPSNRTPALLLIPPDDEAISVICPPFENVCLPSATSITELFDGL